MVKDIKVGDTVYIIEPVDNHTYSEHTVEHVLEEYNGMLYYHLSQCIYPISEKVVFTSEEDVQQAIMDKK